MVSKWFELKIRAIKSRKNGNSLRDIEKKFGVPRSTLSGWFKDIKLEKKYQTKLHNNWKNALKKARKKAVRWHNQQKELRIKIAENQALETLLNLDNKSKPLQELALAMLYLGEGSKTKNGTVMGNSDPLILKFFVNSLLEIYNIDAQKIKCSLHLRVDQDPKILTKFWSNELNIPIKNFTSFSVDLRSTGRSTYSNYNGVCVVSCGNIAIQRKLIYLSRKFCEDILS